LPQNSNRNIPIVLKRKRTRKKEKENHQQALQNIIRPKGVYPSI
jgi:hypothetical protein